MPSSVSPAAPDPQRTLLSGGRVYKEVHCCSVSAAWKQKWPPCSLSLFLWIALICIAHSSFIKKIIKHPSPWTSWKNFPTKNSKLVCFHVDVWVEEIRRIWSFRLKFKNMRTHKQLPLFSECWHSYVGNISSGRCWDHVTTSIHKIPGCPFTVLYTVSLPSADQTYF